MGIAASSRSSALGAITSTNSVGISLAALRSLWQALTARFRSATPSAAPAPFMHVAAARRTVPGLSLAAVAPQIAMKTGAIHVFHAAASAQKQCQTVMKASSPRRLKVVREFEAGISPSCAGRMVISGRMADVCAELDRMVLKESLIPAD